MQHRRRRVVFSTPIEALKRISVIYQERQLVKTLSVTENIFMEHLPTRKWVLSTLLMARHEAQKIIDTLELPIGYGKGGTFRGTSADENTKAYRRNSQIIALMSRHPV